MTVTSAPSTSDSARVGVFNYLDRSVRHSLYRNGEVLTRRDRDGCDAGTQGVSLEEQKMTILNARCLNRVERRTVASSGFELLPRPLADPELDFFRHEHVAREYYGECARIVQETTGAPYVFAFDHYSSAASRRCSSLWSTGSTSRRSQSASSLPSSTVARRNPRSERICSRSRLLLRPATS